MIPFVPQIRDKVEQLNQVHKEQTTIMTIIQLLKWIMDIMVAPFTL